MKKRLISCTLVVILLITSVSPAFADYVSRPKFFCQLKTSTSPGSEWRTGVPTATQDAIHSSGCALSCCGMVFGYTQTVNSIFDERTGQTHRPYGDPYVAYRVNGNTTYMYWDTVRQAFGWSKYTKDSNFVNYTESQKATTIANLIANLKKPIARIPSSPNHYVLFIETDLVGPYSVGEETLDFSELNSISAFDVEMQEDGEIVYSQDFLNYLEATSTGAYDNNFWIHEPAKALGDRIYYSQNTKGATIGYLADIRYFTR